MKCVITDNADILNNKVIRMRLCINGILVADHIKGFLDYKNFIKNDDEMKLESMSISSNEVVLYFEGNVEISRYVEYRERVISILFDDFSDEFIKEVLENMKSSNNECIDEKNKIF